MQYLGIIIALVLVSSLVVAVSVYVAYQFGKLRANSAYEEVATLNRIGLRLLRAQTSVSEVTQMVYELAGELVPTSTFQLGLFDEHDYVVKVWYRDDKRLLPSVFPGGADRGIVGWIRQNGEPIIIDDFEAEKDDLPELSTVDTTSLPRSGLFVPLIAGQKTIGVMAIQSHQTGRFKERDLRLLTAMANQAAAAISQATLYESANRRAEQINLLSTITNQITAVQPLQSLFEQIVTLTRDTFGYYCVSVFLVSGGSISIGSSTDKEFFKTAEAHPGKGMVGWAAHSGETTYAPDVAQDTRYIKHQVLADTQSELAIPLIVEERILGVLDVQSDKLDAFNIDDIHLLETLAGQIALAYEQAKTYHTQRQLALRLEALVQISQAVVSVLNLDDLLERVVELIADTFGFERVHIFIRLADMIVFRAGTGPHSIRWMLDELSYHKDDPGLIPKVVRTGIAELVQDTEKDDVYRPGPGVEDTRSEMAVPIQMAGRVTGVLDVQSTHEQAFSQEDLVLMGSLADSVAVAIRNAALYANERRRRNLADALQEVSSTLARELDIDLVITEVLRGLRRVVNLNNASIFLLDENHQTLTAYMTSGPDLEGFAGYRTPIDRDEPLSIEHLETFALQLYRQLLPVSDDDLVVSAPLIVGNAPIGLLIADQLTLWTYTKADSEIISAFANQAAIAISNARLYAAQQVEAYVTTVLLQVAEAVNATEDTQEALETIARVTALLAGVNNCLIMRWSKDEAAYYPVAQYGIPQEQFAPSLSIPIPTESHPVIDLLSVADFPLGAGENHQVQIPGPIAGLMTSASIMCYPLRAKSGPIGLLIVDDQVRSAERLTSILRGIAHQTATVLETSDLQSSALERDRLEQELRVARKIQASFIPDKLPQIEGWDISAAWKAARQVSGDFYDFIPLPEGRWGLVMADVADKGTPAALFMAVSRTLLRAAAISRLSPSETLARVNELLFNDARNDLFVTVFYGIWNPENGHFIFASAGHNPALYLQSNQNSVSELKTRGIALGVIPKVEIEEKEIFIKPNEMLISYTDGITEAMRSDHTEWGLDRFKTSVLKLKHHPAETMLDMLLSEIEEFIGDAPQSDDLTVWMLKRN